MMAVLSCRTVLGLVRVQSVSLGLFSVWSSTLLCMCPPMTIKHKLQTMIRAVAATLQSNHRRCHDCNLQC